MVLSQDLAADKVNATVAETDHPAHHDALAVQSNVANLANLSILHPYFGIVGDGSDETDRIQAWMDACIMDGAVGVVPAAPNGGTYGWSGALYPCGDVGVSGMPNYAGAKLRGVGPFRAVFTALSADATWIFGDDTHSRNDGYLENFEVDGGGIATRLWQVTLTGWQFQYVGQVFLHDCDPTTGIAIDTFYNQSSGNNNANNGVSLERVRIYRSRYGIRASKQSEFWTLNQVWINDCPGYGLKIQCNLATGGQLNNMMTLINCAIQPVAQSGSYSGISGARGVWVAGCRNLIVVGGWWENVGTNLAAQADGSDNTSRALYIQNTSDSGNHSLINKVTLLAPHLTGSAAGGVVGAGYAIEMSNDANRSTLVLDAVDWGGTGAWLQENPLYNDSPLYIPNATAKEVLIRAGSSTPNGNYAGMTYWHKGATWGGDLDLSQLDSLQLPVGTQIGGATTSLLQGSKVWDPGSMINAGSLNTTVTVTGAVVGDRCVASFDQITVGNFQLTAQVTATNTVTVTLTNHTGSLQDLSSGTMRVDVWH